MDIAFATGSNEANDGAHDRRLEQTRQVGKIFCPIFQSGELVQVPERIRKSCSLHRFRLGWVQKDKKINIRRMHPQRAHMLEFWSKTQGVVALSSAVNASVKVVACRRTETSVASVIHQRGQHRIICRKHVLVAM